MKKYVEYYAIYLKKDKKISVFKEKSQVLDYLKVSMYLFNKNFKSNLWETNDFLVTICDNIELSSRRGDKKGKNLKEYLR